MVYTLDSGSSGGNPVEVRVLFSVPLMDFLTVRNVSNQYVIGSSQNPGTLHSPHSNLAFDL